MKAFDMLAKSHPFRSIEFMESTLAHEYQIFKNALLQGEKQLSIQQWRLPSGFRNFEHIDTQTLLMHCLRHGVSCLTGNFYHFTDSWIIEAGVEQELFWFSRQHSNGTLYIAAISCQQNLNLIPDDLHWRPAQMIPLSDTRIFFPIVKASDNKMNIKTLILDRIQDLMHQVAGSDDTLRPSSYFSRCLSHDRISISCTSLTQVDVTKHNTLHYTLHILKTEPPPIADMWFKTLAEEFRLIANKDILEVNQILLAKKQNALVLHPETYHSLFFTLLDIQTVDFSSWQSFWFALSDFKINQLNMKPLQAHFTRKSCYCAVAWTISNFQFNYLPQYLKSLKQLEAYKQDPITYTKPKFQFRND